jgi:ribosomal-protein-alanine N-acetyltransferase
VAETLINPCWRPPTLRTERLTLRALEADDVPAVYQLASNPPVASYMLWDAHTSLAATEAFFRDYVQPKYLEGVPDPFAVCLHEGALIGLFGARWADQKKLCMEIGYWLGEPHWGHGYATEGVRAVIDHLFATYVVERVQAHCKAENIASAHVMEKAGMKYEGTWRSALNHRGRFWDIKWYSVLREDRQQKTDIKEPGAQATESSGTRR